MSTPTGSERIAKRQWVHLGGLSNSRCWRRQQKNRGWVYFYRWD